MNAVSASIAVCRSRARFIDGVSDGKTGALPHDVIVFQMLAGARDY
jgi:hypothetical protein